MVAKKKVEDKADSKEVEFNAEQTHILELKDKAFKALLEENESLKTELNEVLQQQAFATIEGVSIKHQMLIAILPQVSVSYPHSSAQKALEAVEVIMQAWGME